ncbi:MAG: VOC family protein [Rhodanobacteraceae bacterium]|nr:VOC family protein [Rhodanobacteraceae bacterium]HPF74033.1 VOC family protein [Xanthomonadaceae bacterium]HRX99771.1 VOC family protein [Xanthomonadaceae bacterium]
MAHHSRLAGFIIDCRTDDLDASANFWSQALGMPETDRYEEGSSVYAELDGSAHGMHIEVQRVSHESRVHLDIETDDIDAEVERLEKLGAKRVAFVKRWWVMEAPSGQRFCVVKMKNPERGPAPTRWD